jgi:hypothetical protein
MAFRDWIEIFRGGQQVDAAGQTHNGDALIDKATASYDPAKHQAPVVIGHPSTDAPAYAWVEGLRASVHNGVKTLEAKLTQVDEGFAKLVADGRFKMRSAAFYPDGSLRHVGFLGAAPPAVKGLKPIAFSEGEFNEFYALEEINNMDKAQTSPTPAGGDIPANPTLQGQLQQALQEKEAIGRQFAELQAKTKAAEHKRYLEDLTAQGLILPYQQPGLLHFMEVLSQTGEPVIAFTEKEGGEEEKLSPLEFFKKHLEGGKRHGLFVESGKPKEGKTQVPAFDMTGKM